MHAHMNRYVCAGTPEEQQSPDALDAQTLVHQLWELPPARRPHTAGAGAGAGAGAAHPRMPAPNPVSLMRRDLPRLRRYPYLVSRKLDGTRYLLIIGSNENTGEGYAFLIDRAYHMYRIQVHTLQDSGITNDDIQQGTLLDGELMEDQGFVIFDIVSDCGVDCKARPYTHRLDRLRALVPALEASANGTAVQLSVKPCVPLHQVESLQSLPQGGAADGIIFMPVQQKVLAGMHRSMFKWKPHNTIDFWMIDQNGTPGLFFSTKDGLQPIQALHLDLHTYDKDILRHAPCVVECSCRPKKDPAFEVDILVVRPDKDVPNFERTVRLTLQNIRENIKYEELVKWCSS